MDSVGRCGLGVGRFGLSVSGCGWSVRGCGWAVWVGLGGICSDVYEVWIDMDGGWMEWV